jgi:hypothetical protein
MVPHFPWPKWPVPLAILTTPRRSTPLRLASNPTVQRCASSSLYKAWCKAVAASCSVLSSPARSSTSSSCISNHATAPPNRARARHRLLPVPTTTILPLLRPPPPPARPSTGRSPGVCCHPGPTPVSLSVLQPLHGLRRIPCIMSGTRGVWRTLIIEWIILRGLFSSALQRIG